MKELYDIIIIGSGPAGYTAGIYAARSNSKTLILEGTMPGGQLLTTTTVENFPGFKVIDGFQLVTDMKEQAEENGCLCISKNAVCIQKNDNYFIVKDNDDNIYNTKSVILAMGATAKKLEFHNSDVFWNKGISACAVCDGALPCFRKKTLVVIGGGDSAMEEALFLSRFGSKVIILVRSNKLRASNAMINKVRKNDKIEIRFNEEVKEANGDDMLENITIVNNQSSNQYTQECSGLFFGIGHTPNTSLVSDIVELKENGYIARHDSTTRTNISGIFAAGDIADDVYRQAITAAGSGCMAALDCVKFLEQFD
jgi:thioredoxin reductase (NADPH)